MIGIVSKLDEVITTHPQFQHVHVQRPRSWGAVKALLCHLRESDTPLEQVVFSNDDVDLALIGMTWGATGEVRRPHVSLSAATELAGRLLGTAPETFGDAVDWLCWSGLVQCQGDLLLLQPAWLADVVRPLVRHDLTTDGAPSPEVDQALTDLILYGKLSPVALAHLWEGLVPPSDSVRRDTLALLQRVSCLVVVPGQEGHFLVSARLPKPQDLSFWEPAEVEISWVLRRAGGAQYLPPGLTQSVMAVCAADASRLSAWSKGFVMRSNTGVWVRVADEGSLLRLSVRARLEQLEAAWAALERAEALARSVRRERFSGLRDFTSWAQCGRCLGQGRSEPPRQYQVATLESMRSMGHVPDCTACQYDKFELFHPPVAPPPPTAVEDVDVTHTLMAAFAGAEERLLGAVAETKEAVEGGEVRVRQETRQAAAALEAVVVGVQAVEEARPARK